MKPPIKQPLALDSADKLVKQMLQSIHIDSDDLLDLSGVKNDVLYGLMDWPREDIKKMCYPFYQTMRHNKANPETFDWAFTGAYGLVRREVMLELARRILGKNAVESAITARWKSIGIDQLNMSKTDRESIKKPPAPPVPGSKRDNPIFVQPTYRKPKYDPNDPF